MRRTRWVLLRPRRERPGDCRAAEKCVMPALKAVLLLFQWVRGNHQLSPEGKSPFQMEHLN
jgi:hypothetical protein